MSTELNSDRHTHLNNALYYIEAASRQVTRAMAAAMAYSRNPDAYNKQILDFEIKELRHQNGS